MKSLSKVASAISGFLCATTSVLANDIYIAQTQAGTHDGSSAANAQAVTFFNTTANWGAGASQIGPGTTVHLVGQINTPLVTQASGAAGNVITVLFEAGASMSAPHWNQSGIHGDAAIAIFNNYITIDGGAGGGNGFIEATANGTNLANRVFNNGIYVFNGTNVTVQNLTLRNLYVRVNGSDPGPGANQSGSAIEYLGVCTNGLIKGCTIHDQYIGILCAYETFSNFTIENCAIFDTGDGIDVGEAAANYTVTGVFVHDNVLTMGSTWEGNPSIHRVCFHGFGVVPAVNLINLQIYNNIFTGDLANNATAFCFLEGFVTSASVYNNLFLMSTVGSGGNGMLAFKGTESCSATNNTFIGFAGSTEIGLGSETDLVGTLLGHNLVTANNLYDNCYDAIYDSGPVITASDYNLFFNDQLFVTVGNFISTLAGWTATTGFDSHSLTLDPALDPTTHIPQPPSGAIDAGTPQGGYSVDMLGTARPQGLAWDIGAFEYVPTGPVITSAFSVHGTQGNAGFTYTVTGTGSPTSFTATGLPAGLSIDSTTGIISGTPTAFGFFIATIGATGGSGTGTAFLQISINQVTPVITSTLTASGVQGTAFAGYTITANNSPATFSATGLPSGLNINTSTGVISGTPSTFGAFNVTIGGTNTGGTGSATLVLTIGPAVPVITSTGNFDIYKGLPTTYTIVATNNPTSFTAGTLPAGLVFDTTTGIISGIPTANGTTNFTIGATNVTGTGTRNLQIIVSPEPVPVVTSSTTLSATNGTAFTYTITGSNSPTLFAVTGLPTGLTLNTSTGVISGTPTVVAVSTLHISATNAGGTGTATATLTVANLLPPVISSVTSATGAPGSAFTYTIVANHSPASYSATGLPSGLNVDTTTGIISGTPSGASTASVTIGATNAAGTGSATLTITITVPISPPAISSATTSMASTGGSFSYTITASNSPSSYNASGLPAGLSINSSTGVISGTPTASTGVYNVSISATNSVGSGSANLSLSIVAPSARLINLSARTDAGTGSNSLIAGFVISGASKSVLVRGIGPSLANFSVTGFLPDPQLGIYSGPTNILSDIMWGNAPTLSAAFSQVGAFLLGPTSTDSALLSSLPAGPYTAQVSGVSGDTGNALVEVYDADPNILSSPSRLINLSTRTFVGTGTKILIGGFVIGGSGTETVLIRAIGPGLSTFGVPGVLANPQLTLFDNSGTAVATNSGWGGTTTLSNTFALVGAFPLSPTSNDSALLVTLAPGAYTAQVSGIGQTTGVALVEIYEVPTQ